MKKRFSWLLLLIFCLSLLYSIVPTFSVQWSTTRQFNVAPDIVYLNWTNNYNSSFNITVNDTYGDWFNVTIDNATATGTVPYSLFFNYTSSAYTCGAATPCAKVMVYNETGNHNVQSKNLTNTPAQNNATFYLVNNESSSLSPGRYRGIVRIYNTSIPAEYVNISAVLDIPMRIDNNTGIGSFSGTLPINASTYQSFYFNTNLLPNATAVKINISGWLSSQDVDLFLFDNSSTQQLLAKSINKSSTSENLVYSFLPSTEKMWEIRVYGNHTSSSISYSGNIYFTTLNSSNRTLDYGLRNSSYTNQSIVMLNNAGNLNISNVLESKELYYINRFAGNSIRNFTFLSPDSSIVQRIKVSLNWTGPSNSSYMFNVYKPDNTFMMDSANKFLYANVTIANLEEYNETTDVTKGYWRVEVKNSTNITATAGYNLAVYLYVNASNWFATNYTNSSSGFTFNATNSTSIQVNLTIPNTTMNGLYDGSLQYLDKNGVGIKIPINISVAVPTLVVNGTLSSSTVTVVENINATLTRVLNITLNNTGSYNISSITTTNSTSLNYGNYYINFSYQAPTSLSAGRSAVLNITMNLNTSITNDTTGIYSGWIILNTNESINPSSPYPNFTLNIQFNLTNFLDVRVIGVNTYDTAANWITNASTLPKNVTIQYLNLYYINGTQITGTSLFNYTNITSVRLYQANANYWSSYLNKSETGFLTNPFEETTGNYRFNFTVPANLPGGDYQVHASLTNANGKLAGESLNRTLTVNNTGLNMNTTNSTSISIGNTSTYMFAVNVSNYGPLAASSATINLTESCAGYSVAYTGMTGGCLGSGTGVTATISPPASNTSCVVWWTITASASASACTAYVMGGPTSKWFNPNYINVSITISGGGTSDSSTSGSSSQTTTTTLPYTANLAFTKADSLITVQQNSSNSTNVGVNNTGTVNQNITFAIENINSSWYSVNATNAYLVVGKSAGFKVNFNVGNVEVKDYNGIFKAFSVNKTITSNFALRVTPAPTKKTEINDTLASYKINATKLGQEISQKKKQGFNTTAVEKKFADLNSSIQKAEDYIKAGDYNNAYYLFDDIKKLFDEIKDDLSKVKKTGWSGLFTLPEGYTLYILVGGGIAVAGVLGYLFWPTRGAVKPAYTILKTEEVKKVKIIPSKPKLESLKEFLNELKEKLSKIFKREKAKPIYLGGQSSKT